MDLQLRDRIVDETGEYEVIGRPYATAPVPPDLKANPGSRKAVMAVIVALHDKFFERAAPSRPVRTLQPIPIRPSHTSSPARGAGSTTAVDLEFPSPGREAFGEKESWVTSPTCLPSASRMERENVFSVALVTSRPAFAQNAAMFLMVFA
jgi:hypothetical protein